MGGYLERLKTKKRLPQALPKLPKGENTPTHGTAKTAKSPFDSKDSKGGGHISETPPEISATIPAPEPAGLGAEYAELWNRAWRLADYIDSPGGAPIEARRARLPELMRLRDQMAAIEGQAGPEPETPPADTWHPWESSSTTTPEGCPAKCKRSGKCYALAYYQGKPGPAKDCEPEGCDRYPGTLLPCQF